MEAKLLADKTLLQQQLALRWYESPSAPLFFARAIPSSRPNKTPSCAGNIFAVLLLLPKDTSPPHRSAELSAAEEKLLGGVTLEQEKLKYELRVEAAESKAKASEEQSAQAN